MVKTLPVVVNVPVSVVDSEDNPLENVVVTVDDTEITCTTGAAGGCNLQKVPVGTINYTATLEGYDTVTESFTVAKPPETLSIVLEETS